MTLDCPRLLTDVISLTAAICPNCRSSGVVTAEAIVSGLAPGSEALTEIVGKSTCGSGETGSSSNATKPPRPIAIVSSVVATGRRMKISEIFISRDPELEPRADSLICFQSRERKRAVAAKHGSTHPLITLDSRDPSITLAVACVSGARENRAASRSEEDINHFSGVV